MIVVFGSINVDLTASVAALPRAGETVLANDYRTVPGGKGANQALAAARAGGDVALFGSVGSDHFADLALIELRAEGVGLQGVATRAADTGLAMICVDRSGQNQIVVASGANRRSHADQVPDDILGPGTTLLLQLEVPVTQNQDLIRRARRSGATIILNAAPANPIAPDSLASLDVLVVNELEANTLSDALGSSHPCLRSTAESLSRAFDLTAVVTLGGAGAIAATREETWAIGAVAVEAIDTTGAGDAFTGGLAAGLDFGFELPQALRQASVGAALACTVAGAQPSLPRISDIEAHFGDLQPATRI